MIIIHRRKIAQIDILSRHCQFVLHEICIKILFMELFRNVFSFQSSLEHSEYCLTSAPEFWFGTLPLLTCCTFCKGFVGVIPFSASLSFTTFAIKCYKYGAARVHLTIENNRSTSLGLSLKPVLSKNTFLFPHPYP